ncbi:hypothetical protein QR66_13080 [Chromobacterium piscinae]|nr:hypothetical protein QR66_13080 [Chromobacterium piscinae]
MQTQQNLSELLKAWQAFSQLTDIRPIREPAHYDQLCDLLNALWDETQGKEEHPLADLCRLVGMLVDRYEQAHHPANQVSGLDALRFLMQEHGLQLGDMTEIGSPVTVAEVLAGARELSLRQVKQLAARFGVSPATFID